VFRSPGTDFQTLPLRDARRGTFCARQTGRAHTRNGKSACRAELGERSSKSSPRWPSYGCGSSSGNWYLLLIVAVLLAVTLDPLVRWVERRGLGRGMASTLVLVTLVAVSLAFITLASSSLTSQGELVVKNGLEFEKSVVERTPQDRSRGHLQTFRTATATSSRMSPRWARDPQLTPSRRGRAAALDDSDALPAHRRRADGPAWLLAFVPLSRRSRARQTMVEARRVMLGYVVGNAATIDLRDLVRADRAVDPARAGRLPAGPSGRRVRLFYR